MRIFPNPVHAMTVPMLHSLSRASAQYFHWNLYISKQPGIPAQGGYMWYPIFIHGKPPRVNRETQHMKSVFFNSAQNPAHRKVLMIYKTMFYHKDMGRLNYIQTTRNSYETSTDAYASTIIFGNMIRRKQSITIMTSSFYVYHHLYKFSNQCPFTTNPSTMGRMSPQRLQSSPNGARTYVYENDASLLEFLQPLACLMRF